MNGPGGANPTARVILKGLCAFLVNSKEDKAAVLLVNHPGAADGNGMGIHNHLSRVRWTGFDAAGNPVVAPWSLLEGSLRFDWGTTPTPSLDVPSNFYDFVPRFTDIGATDDAILDAGELLAGPSKSALPALANGFVRAVVICDAGQLEISDVVRFWRHRSNAKIPHFRGPKVQQRVWFPGAAVGRPEWAGLATEARVYIESQEESGGVFNLRFTDRADVSLSPSPGNCSGANEVSAACHDIGDNFVEVSVSNFSRRLPRPLPYSAHYQWFFNLLATPIAPDPDLPAAVDVATAGWGPFFKSELATDLGHVGGANFPFPLIRNPVDAGGAPIMDEEDRPICPLVGGKD